MTVSPSPSEASALKVQAEQLYRHSRATLRPALAGRLGSAADADDVLHEAFTRFLATYAGRSILNPLAMLARIAMNIVRDTARANSSRATLLDRHCHMLVQTPPNPEVEAGKRQDLRHLCDAIDTLPPRCRQVFLLCRIDGMPQAEVASLLGISKSGVEKHLIRARNQLNQYLGSSFFDRIDRPALPHI